jgi:hypothetical protein
MVGFASEIRTDSDEWLHEAACRGKNPVQWELSDQKNRSGYHSSDDAALLLAGQEICRYCPVQTACLLASDAEDRKWTTRGGCLPTAFRPLVSAAPPEGRGMHRVTAEQKRAGFCSNGHDITDPGALSPRDSCRRCQTDRKRECDNVTRRRRESSDEVREEGYSFNREKTHCPRGHEYNEENTRYQTIKRNGKDYRVRRCAACRSEKGQ